MRGDAKVHRTVSVDAATDAQLQSLMSAFGCNYSEALARAIGELKPERILFEEARLLQFKFSRLNLEMQFNVVPLKQ